MKYKRISLLKNKQFKDLTAKEANEYLAWYLSVIDDRIAELQNFIGDEFELVTDVSSLVPLDIWFRKNIVTQNYSEEEKDAILSKMPDWYVKSNLLNPSRLTEDTFSLAIDIGMFFSKILLANDSSINWHVNTSAKRFVDYNQPVLKGRGKMVFNPSRIMVTYANSHALNSPQKKTLKQLHYLWSEILSTGKLPKQIS